MERKQFLKSLCFLPAAFLLPTISKPQKFKNGKKYKRIESPVKITGNRALIQDCYFEIQPYGQLEIEGDGALIRNNVFKLVKD